MFEERPTALIHHWLVTMRGGERVFEELVKLFPAADLFSLVCDNSRLSPPLRRRPIQTSMLQHLPRATQWYRYYLPLFPLATRRMDLSAYDVVISSDAATVKGVQCGQAIHICYCHSPMRYVWQSYEIYHRAAGPIGRHVLGACRKTLCEWDYEAAQRVTHFVANSKNVQRRIYECYGRQSRVIYPPVGVDRFEIALQRRPTMEESFLVVSQLVPYKRIDLLIHAFNRCRRRLTVIGDGPERGRLECLAGKTIRILGPQSDASVVAAMQEATAFVFAGEEDFGIVMAEAQACGKPVIALGRGGANEIVEPGISGLLFEEPSTECIIDALDRFDRAAFDPLKVRASALRFSPERFRRELGEFVGQSVGKLNAIVAPLNLKGPR
jgi:glycosyltransferase involved in cell wall biosynthesis